MKKFFALITALLCCTQAFASPPERQVLYVNGTTIRSNDVMANEDEIFGYLQTGVDTLRTGAVDSLTELSTSLCSNGQSFVKSSGSWACGSVASSGGGALNQITDPTASGGLNLTSFTNIWTSTLDGGTVFTFSNSDADLAADTSIFDFKFTDDGDSNGYFWRAYDNSGGDLKASLGADGALIAGSISSTGTGQSTFEEGVIINNAGGNASTDDFIVEGDTEDNLFRVHASDNTVRIGDYDTNYTQFNNAGTMTFVGNSAFFLPQSTTLPATCTAGASYIDTNATSGQRLYLCESTNTWVAVGSAASSVAYDDIADPDANKTISFSSFTNSWTSTATASDVFTLKTTGNHADTSLMVLQEAGSNPTDGTMLEFINTDSSVDSILAPNFALTQAGFVGIGDISPEYALDVERTVSQTNTTVDYAGHLSSIVTNTVANTNYRNFFVEATYNEANNISTGTGFYVVNTHTGSANINHHSAIFGNAQPQGTGTTTDTAGVKGRVEAGNSDDVTDMASLWADTQVVDGSATVSNLYGVRVLSPSVTTPANVTDYYGLYMPNPTTGTLSAASNNIGIAIGSEPSSKTAGFYMAGSALLDMYLGNGTFNNASSDEDLYVEGNIENDGTLYGNIASINRISVGGEGEQTQIFATSTTGPTVTLKRNDTTVTAGDALGTIDFRNNDATSTTNQVGARIIAEADINFNNDYSPTNIDFYTTPNTVASGLLKRLQIDDDGNINIGASVAVESILSVDKGTGVGQFTLDGSTGGCIMLRDTDDAGWTECDALDGALSCSIDADGVCD